MTEHSQQDKIGRQRTADGRSAVGRSNVAAAVAAALIVAIGVGLEYPRWGATFTPARVFFAGPDDYMRAYRARQIADGHTMRIRHMAEINAPAGVELHWTAPMDWLIVGAHGVVGSMVAAGGRADSLGAVAAVIPICLGALYLIAIMAFMRRGFGWTPALIAGLVVAVTPPFHRAFMLGHVDHQCLLELLFVLAIGGLIPARRGSGLPGRPSIVGAVVSGLATGLAIWVAAQAMVVWLAVLAGLSLATGYGAARHRRRWVAVRFVWSGCVVSLVLAGHLIENWPDLATTVVDKVSLFHLLLTAIGLFLPAIGLGSSRGHSAHAAPDGERMAGSGFGLPSRTTLNIALLVVVALTVIWLNHRGARTLEPLSRPEFLRWSEHVAELQPMYVKTADDWSLRRVHAELGYVPYALPFLLMFFIRSRRVPIPLKLTCGLLAPAVTILAIQQVRWMDHYNMAVAPVLAIGLCEMLHRISPRTLRFRPAATFVWAGLAAVALLFPAGRNTLERRTEGEIRSRGWLERNDFVAEQIQRYEASHPGGSAGRRAALCDDADGPVLLYYAGLPVVSTAYHRAIDGLLEASAFFAETDPAAARSRLDRLGVRYIVVPQHANEQLAHYEAIAFGELRSFDPPDERIDANGQLRRRLNYRPSVMNTMIYRLQMHPLSAEFRAENPVIPGVELIATYSDDPRDPSLETGLLYVVHDGPPGVATLRDGSP